MDKLDQRLYIFEDGEIYDVLVISTGLPNERQPYNETRSGEFLLVSPVGGFEVEGLNAAMGRRFNFGDILHEVPYSLRSGSKNYSHLTACPYCVPPRTVEEINAINQANRLP